MSQRLSRDRLSELTILDLMVHPRLLGPVFSPPSWDAWRSILRVEYALPISGTDRGRFRELAHREQPPSQPVRRSYRRVGRRGGKDSIAGLEAVYRSAFPRYPLRVGELGVGLILAADKRQARLLHRTVREYFRLSPILESLVESETAESIELRNHVAIEIVAANLVAPRNRTIVFAIANEIAYWPTDEQASSPDIETLNAIEAGMATIPTSKVVVMSSPYGRAGELWRASEQYFGRDEYDDVVYWAAPTRALNPTVSTKVVERALAEDESRAQAEYLAEFRSDLESFVQIDAVRQCLIEHRHELPAQPDITYEAVVDPAGGSGSDSFTLAIGHQERRGKQAIAIVDAVRETRPPFSPAGVVQQYAALLASYRVRTVHGDRFAGEFPRELFREHTIEYEPLDRPKSDLYVDALPLLNSARVELLDHPRLVAQITGLERRTARGGRDSIDHPPSAHDDLANAVCALAVQLVSRRHTIAGVWGGAKGHQE